MIPTARTPKTFLSTPSVRRATRDRCRNAQAGYRISIHALREEGDEMMCNNLWERIKFLSTPSVRRATCVGT